jgi:Tfp pilus assembly protein FimT
MRSARPRGGPAQSQSGFSLAELTVLLAVIGALFSLSLPAFLSYYQTAQVRGAASDIAAYLNLGRQLAIQQNRSICVHIEPAAVHYHLNANCSGPRWVGPGTAANGDIPAPDGIALTTTADPVFTYLGAAAPAGTVTVSDGSHTLSVIVSASGRVTVGP